MCEPNTQCENHLGPLVWTGSGRPRERTLWISAGCAGMGSSQRRPSPPAPGKGAGGVAVSTSKKTSGLGTEGLFVERVFSNLNEHLLSRVGPTGLLKNSGLL